MKNVSYILSIVLMLLTVSCSRVERIPTQREIAIRPMGSPLSKVIAYPENKVFGVYAFYADCPAGIPWDDHSAWWASTAYLDSVAFMYNGTYAAGYDMELQSHKPYYWPLSGSLLFAGYSPHQGDSNGTIDTVNFVLNMSEQIANPYFEIDFRQATSPSEMVDLMWFDVMDVNNGMTVAKSDTPVSLQFKHALSLVSFEFADVHNVYKLVSVVLKDCINTATFYSGNTAGWMPDITAVEDYVMLEDQNLTLNQWESEPLYIIPQYLDGIYPTLNGTLDSGVDVVLTFELTDGFGSQLVEIPLKNYTERWEMGKHYKYTVTVNADPIDFGTPGFTITTQIVAM